MSDVEEHKHRNILVWEDIIII